MRPQRPGLIPSLFVLASCAALAVSACGGATPPPVPTTPSKPIAVTPEAPVDLSPVPEPAGLVLVGRVSKVEGILKTLVTWTRLPLPGAADLVRSIADDSVADAVDLSQPIDGAISLGGSKRDPKPLIAVSVPLRSFDEAKAKIGARHKLTAAKDGQFLVEGIGRSSARGAGLAKGEEDDEGESCVLAPAVSGARLVCGERDAIDALSPYLTRTVPLQKWTSDIHVEVSLAAIREPLLQFRSTLPVLARQMLGASSPALAQIVDAAVNEIVEFVGDSGRMSLDAQVADSGLQMTMKADYQKSQSFLARLATSNPQLADAPPPAFAHLPGDADVAMFTKGSDPKLFDHPRELLGKALLEVTQGASVPEAEAKTVRELIVDRMLGLLTGPLVYGKGYDTAALEKGLAAQKATEQKKTNDPAAADEADRTVSEQVFGWHLMQVNEPITKVGPMLKDWAQLWNRPAFVKWAKQQASASKLAQMRIAPPPAGVTLPKDVVHLEIVLPRAAIEAAGPPKKKVPVKPYVLHVLAVPDQGGTWLGLGLDAKLLAQKAAASLSSAPDTATLGKAPTGEALRTVKANGAWLLTVRGVLGLKAFERSRRPPFPVSSLPSKGETPIVLSFVSQGPSQSASAGSAVVTLNLPRSAIEDVMTVTMSRR